MTKKEIKKEYHFCLYMAYELSQTEINDNNYIEYHIESSYNYYLGRAFAFAEVIGRDIEKDYNNLCKGCKS